MTHVLILEDDRASREALERILLDYSDSICVHAASSYDEAEELLNSDVRYALFLLDVNLRGENREDISGILFAREIREKFCYTFTPVVMVTAIGALEMQAYRELHCYQYIMKPFLKEQVEDVVRKVLEKEKQEEPPSVTVKRDGINYQVKCSDILYIEAIYRGICLHLKNEDWNIPYISLKQMIAKLPDSMFIQCHRMYVVNRREVEYYDTVNRIVKLKDCEAAVEIGVTYKSEIGRLLSG
ncbi:LytTR family DNA-binding domain-containing protein [Lachnospiraceae bacterium 42-17]|jgi:DNA-binding LytR/AlgR family response regulator